MHVCGICGIQFDPVEYQVVANGLSYHSVDCAVRALDRVQAVDPIAELTGEDEPAGLGRTYSITGSLGMPTSRRPAPRAPVSDEARGEPHAAGF